MEGVFSWQLATAISGSPELEKLLGDGWEPFSIAQVILGQNAITRETQMGLLVGLKKMRAMENGGIKLS